MHHARADAQFRAERESNKQVEKEELTGVQAAVLLEQKMAADRKKKLDEKRKPNDPDYPLIGDNDEEDRERYGGLLVCAC